MNQQRIVESFKAGMYKRAAEYGLDKEAWLAPAVAAAIRTLGPVAGMIGTPTIVARLASEKNKLGKAFGLLNKGFTHKNPWISNSMHIGTQLATAPLYEKASDALANVIHKPEEQQQQYQG